MRQATIAIIGAGPAGIAAAASAARLGRSVLLIDATARLGGSVTAAMHRSLCGLYAAMPESPLDTLNTGVQRDLVAHMLKLDGSNVVAKTIGKTVVLEMPLQVYESALRQAIDQPEIELQCSARLTDVKREGNHISAIQVNSHWIETGAVIDCTGSGALMQTIGQDVMHPPDAERMLGGYAMHLTGLTGDLQLLRVQVPYILARQADAGVLPPEARFTTLHPGPGIGEAICKLAVNPTDFSSQNLESAADQIIAHLKLHLPSFADVKVAEHSPRPLPRDGRRLLGQATVTEQDVIVGHQLSDSAIHAWWPIEHWHPVNGPSYAYAPVGRHYDIPDAALQSGVIDNLFAAGMCVSATAAAAGSLRASGICLATGDHAGRLAARSSD